MLGAQAVDQEQFIQHAQVPNFAARMMAELRLYGIIYGSTVATHTDWSKSQAILQEWRQDHAHLLAGPRHQFLEMSWAFAQMLLHERAMPSRGSPHAVRESTINELVILSLKICNVAQETSDDRTAYLSDHIYHMIAFAALTMCRLLSKHEDLIHHQGDYNQLDRHLMQTATWLKSVGSSRHVAGIMSDLISSTHRKLRPEAYARIHPSSVEFSQLSREATPSRSDLPEFLWMYDADGVDWNINIS